MGEFDKIMSSLESIRRFPLEGKYETETASKGLMTLYEVNEQIEYVRKIRERILKEFEKDTDVALKKYPSKGLAIDEKQIFEDGLVRFSVDSRIQDSFCLVSKTGIKKCNIFGTILEDKIEKVLPYVRGLLAVYERSGVLNNLFYEDLNVLLDAYINRLIISGYGVIFPTEDFKLTEEEELEIKKYYYTHLKSILSNILVKDSSLLDTYRIDIDSKCALEIYKGKR